MKVGVIADTHGFFHPQIPGVFQGVDRILHAGDVGSHEVFRRLQQIAPLIGVRGNYDQELASHLLPDPSLIDLDGIPTLLTHRLIAFEWSTGKEAFARAVHKFVGHPKLIIFGHTHFPVAEEVDHLYFLNPGYCGPDPLEWEPSVGILELHAGEISGKIINLKSRS